MAQQGKDLYEWLRGQDLLNDPAWKALRLQYGGNSTNEEWVQHVLTHAIPFAIAYDQLPPEFKAVQHPIQPPPPQRQSVIPQGHPFGGRVPSSLSEPGGDQWMADEEEGNEEATEEVIPLSRGKVVKKWVKQTTRSILYNHFLRQLLLGIGGGIAFTIFDWATTQSGVELSIGPNPSGVLAFASGLAVLLMVVSDVLLHIFLGRLNHRWQQGGFRAIWLKREDSFLTIAGVVIMAVMFVFNFHYSVIAMWEGFGYVFAMCFAALPTVFQIIFWNTIQELLED